MWKPRKTSLAITLVLCLAVTASSASFSPLADSLSPATNDAIRGSIETAKTGLGEFLGQNEKAKEEPEIVRRCSRNFNAIINNLVSSLVTLERNNPTGTVSGTGITPENLTSYASDWVDKAAETRIRCIDSLLNQALTTCQFDLSLPFLLFLLFSILVVF